MSNGILKSAISGVNCALLYDSGLALVVSQVNARRDTRREREEKERNRTVDTGTSRVIKVDRRRKAKNGSS